MVYQTFRPFLFLLFVLSAAHAQTDSAAITRSVRPPQRWSLKIRQSFQSEDTRPEPAILTATFPKTGASSILIDAAAGLTGEVNQTFFIQGEVEYHRNTLIEKEQNNFQVGIGARQFIGVVNDARSERSWVLNSNVKYNRINEKTATEGLLATLDLTRFLRQPVNAGDFCRSSFALNAPIRCVFGSRQFNAFLSPNVGLEYENRWKAESDSAKGNILRGVLKAYLSVSPMTTDKRGRFLIRVFDLYVDYTARYTFLGTLNEAAGWRPLLDAGINFPIYGAGTEFNRLSIGFSYRYGENPAQGLARQEFWLLAFKVKI
ncbi:hypothetical protein [Larkinella soli]|uniref:hypothetical protein n=1 Tax=Larkinella soli TaxID=1770527 RepID=UPI000FFCAF02|nr:hypothetical protein [Larkinella soli]